MPYAELVQHINPRFSCESHACTEPRADVGLVEVGRFVRLDPDAVANAVRKVLAVTSVGDDTACGDIDTRGCRVRLELLCRCGLGFEDGVPDFELLSMERVGGRCY